MANHDLAANNELPQDETRRQFLHIERQLEEFQRGQEMLREQLLRHEEEYQATIAGNELVCQDLTDRLTGCALRLAELQNQLGMQKNENFELQVQLDHWNAVERSRGWQALQAVYKVRTAIFPRGSHSERLAKLGYKAARKTFRLAKYSLAAVRKRLSPSSFTLPSPIGAAAAAPPPRFVKTPALTEYLEPVEMKGLVSVVLPVYNHATLLKGAIESVLAQTYRNVELIIVNDGSTDGVESVLAEYASHPQIRILTQPNQKVSAAVNNGFQFARGEFWTWTSADNLMMPEQLSKQVAFLQSHEEAAMVYSDYIIIDGNGNLAKDPSFRPHNRYSPEDPVIHLPHSTDLLCVVLDNFIGACFLYRASAARLLGDYDPGLGIDDYDYWMRMNMSFNIAHIGITEPLYQYRVHENSLSAHAAELGIYESVNKLMEYQRERAVFFDKPWTIYIDAATQKFLDEASLPSHRIEPWSGQTVACGGVGKKLILVHAESLPAVAASNPSSDVAVAAWFDEDGFAPYRYRNEIRQLDAVCFARESTILERLALMTAHYFRIGSPFSLLSQLLCFANNRSFMNATRSVAQRTRTAPRSLSPFKRRMRVLLQADDFTQGGLEQVVLDLAASLDRRCFDPLFLVLGKQGPAVEQARAKGIRVLTLPKVGREEAYRNLLNEEEIDLINAHFSIYGGYIASEYGIPFVQTVHNTYIWLSPEEREQYRENDRFTSAYLCVSPLVAQYSDIKLGLSASKMIVVPNGIDMVRLKMEGNTESREKLRAKMGIAPEDFVFLNVASIAPMKAQRELVQAFVRTIATCPQAKLVLLGKAANPDYHAQLMQTIADLDLQKAVIPAGHSSDVAAYYRAADAFVLPSYYEGWSLAMNEAVCANLPLIATDVGGAADLLAEVGGKLIPPPFGSIINLDHETFERHLETNDSQLIAHLAEAMEAVYRERPHPKLTEQFRERLSSQHTYKIYEQVFSWLAQGGQPDAARPWVSSTGNSQSTNVERAA